MRAGKAMNGPVNGPVNGPAIEASSNAPLSVGSVTLLSKNRSSLAEFYRTVIGLNLIAEDDHLSTLGVGDRALLHLREDRSAKIRPTEAGLFHTAFLLPTREDLSAWLRHASDQRVKLDGAADHSVSEALYLQDPEGNGIEIYKDRDRSEWVMNGTELSMASSRLDLKELAGFSDTPWQAAPELLVIGHVHLKVGEVAVSDAFYRDEIGFEKMAAMPEASFYGSGGYHHHIAGNTWQSRGAGKRSEDSTGLLHIELLSAEPVSNHSEHVDPYGVGVTVSGNRQTAAAR